MTCGFPHTRFQVVRSPQLGNHAAQAKRNRSTVWGIACLTGWLVCSIASLRDWTPRLEIIAAIAGIGGMALTYQRWRRHGDRLAKTMHLVALGTWALGVITWGIGGSKAGKPGSLGFDVAAAALLIGFVGGIIVFTRLHAHNDRDQHSPSVIPSAPE